jgi:hypothetical protein
MPTQTGVIGALPVSIALLTLTPLAGCSSKNPDALTNVDENVATAADTSSTTKDAADENAISAAPNDSDSSNSGELAGTDSTQASAADANPSPTPDGNAASNAAVDAAVAALKEVDQLDEQVQAAEDEFNEQSDADNESGEERPQSQR